MMADRSLKIAVTGVIFFLTVMLATQKIWAGSLPEVGTDLPEFTMNATDPDDRTYLGTGDTHNFSLNDVKGNLMVIEIVGVYCPKCHKQFPKMRKLFFQIAKDKALSEKVKILAIAAGASPNEITYLKKQFKIPYPVISDLKFDIHKLLGEPRTPFTMLVKKDRNIVYAHLGLTEDFDRFLAEIRKFAE